MWMDFMKVALADKADEAFSKPNAPKKPIALPVLQTGSGVPILELPPAKSDDQPESPDDAGSDTVIVPSATPSTAAPNDVPSTPAPIVRQTPRAAKPVVPRPVPVKIPPGVVGAPH
jgi:hypothetical protein